MICSNAKAAGLLLMLGLSLATSACKSSRAEARDERKSSEDEDEKDAKEETKKESKSTPSVVATATAAAPEVVSAALTSDPLLPDSGSADAASEPVSPERWVVNRSAGIRFAAPKGWKEGKRGEWVVYVPEDKSALVAFTTFSKANESTAKLGGAAQALGVSNVDWGQAKSMRIGEGDFVARVAGGKCDAGGPASIAYATINPGGSTQVLFVYFVKQGAPKQRSTDVKQLLRSLKRA
jgi:hypothetical protein